MHHQRTRGLRRGFTAVSTVALTVALTVPATAKPSENGCENRNNNRLDKVLTCTDVDGVMEHLQEFQAIADANNGNRAAGTSGYDASAAYVVDTMETAGYDVSVREFEFPYFEVFDATLERVSPDPATFERGVAFDVMTFSGAGDVTATAVGVDLSLQDLDNSTSGCETADFANFPAGEIALIQRGACTFADKAINAEAAGAVGVIIFNQGNTPERSGLLLGTLGDVVTTLPVVGTTFDLGPALLGTEVHLAVDAISEIRTTVNVIAETPGGDPDNVIMAGAHLDSVLAGPGINDNGSGSAVLLEVAQAMHKTDVENKVRFAWWGAEELGLIGSTEYVMSLTQEELASIELYLNFDMVGSPNYGLFVYDGDGDAFGLTGPDGSDEIEALFEQFYAERGIPSRPTAFSGRSDYLAFINNGIPAGGLFTGAEGIKTEAEEDLWGGTAGIAYDPNYHQAGDDITNVSHEALDINVDATAYTVFSYATGLASIND